MELQRRFKGVITKPIHIELPYVRGLDAKRIKRWAYERIEEREWPEYLKEWHKRSFRINNDYQSTNDWRQTD